MTTEWWEDKTKFPKNLGEPEESGVMTPNEYGEGKSKQLRLDAQGIGESTEIVVEIMGGLIGDPEGVYVIGSKGTDLKESYGSSTVAKFLESGASIEDKGAVIDINIDNQYRCILSSEMWGDDKTKQYGPVSLWIKTNPQNSQKAIEYAKKVRGTDEVISVYVETQKESKGDTEQSLHEQDKLLFSYNEEDVQYHGEDNDEEKKVYKIVSAIEALDLCVTNLTNKEISRVKLENLEIDMNSSTTYGYRA